MILNKWNKNTCDIYGSWCGIHQSGEKKGERVLLLVVQVRQWSVSNVGKARTGQPIFDGAYKPFMVIWGMAYCCLNSFVTCHISFWMVIEGLGSCLNWVLQNSSINITLIPLPQLLHFTTFREIVNPRNGLK